MKKISLLLIIIFFASISFAQNMNVNASSSELKWTGKKVTGEHWGFVSLKDGSLNIKNNKIESGVFNIDMSTINCKDLEDETWNKKLVGHLKSDDFFSVDKYPIATLTITNSTPFKDGISNVTAKLSIKGFTHPVNFKVKKEKDEYTATITVDRTKYEVKYGSGKFFDNLGDNMIYDDFILDVKIVLNN